jgi:hypothetical protein
MFQRNLLPDIQGLMDQQANRKPVALIRGAVFTGRKKTA